MKNSIRMLIQFSTLALLFNLTLAGIAGGSDAPVSPNAITRGPYLQMLASTSITLRWRTKNAEIGTVKFGSDPNNLDREQKGVSAVKDHEVQLKNLNPNTKYFYNIVIGKSLIQPKVVSDQSFVTAPIDSRSSRIWVIGDAGTRTNDQKKVRDAYYALEKKEARATDLWLMLGDNAYNSGTDSEYQSAVFDIYKDILGRSAVFSTRGNHEASNGPNGQAVYYDIFTLPKAKELGGMPSGTEAYYSFDYGDVHFICLDSEGSNRTKTGAMAQWLKSDLENTTKIWNIAFWHHPPYTKGSHDSDSETNLVEMRENFLPILESFGVDLVLSGHSHSYERTFQISGHYGKSQTFAPIHQINAGSGRKLDGGAYQRNTANKKGTVYSVAGSSGKISGGKLNHKAMYISLNRLGSVVLDVEAKELNFRFLREDGSIDDFFTIQKASSKISKSN